VDAAPTLGGQYSVSVSLLSVFLPLVFTLPWVSSLNQAVPGGQHSVSVRTWQRVVPSVWSVSVFLPLVFVLPWVSGLNQAVPGGQHSVSVCTWQRVVPSVWSVSVRLPLVFVPIMFALLWANQ
jgi:hypothetical protein